MPRILNTDHCPYCHAKLPEPTPRVCPECMGSIQKRFLATGCLTSRPLLLLVAAGLMTGAFLFR